MYYILPSSPLPTPYHHLRTPLGLHAPLSFFTTSFIITYTSTSFFRREGVDESNYLLNALYQHHTTGSAPNLKPSSNQINSIFFLPFQKFPQWQRKIHNGWKVSTPRTCMSQCNHIQVFPFSLHPHLVSFPTPFLVIRETFLLLPPQNMHKNKSDKLENNLRYKLSLLIQHSPNSAGNPRSRTERSINVLLDPDDWVQEPTRTVRLSRPMQNASWRRAPSLWYKAPPLDPAKKNQLFLNT